MRFAATLLAGILCGCWPDSSGIDPPADSFFFPTGLTLARDGSRLLVANSNFNLRYNGGTVVAVRIRDGGPDGACCAGQACAVRCVDAEIEGCDGVCADPVDERAFVAAAETVGIGSGATDAAMSPDGRRAYVTVRGDGSLTWIDVDPAADRPGGLLSCNPDAGNRRCDGGHTVVRTGNRWVPAEPYSLIADDSWVVVGHVTSGAVSLFRVAASRPPTLERVVDDFPTGSNGIARHPTSGWFFLASRDSRLIYPFTISAGDWRPGEGPAVSVGRAIPVDASSGGSDSRFIAFSPAGDRAWVTNRSPASLLVVDTSSGTGGRVVDMIELGAGPSRVAVLPLAGGGYLVLAVCFDAREMYVVDPSLRAVIDVTRTGAGPHAVVADAASGRVYVANFGESSVWVFDMRPDSPQFGVPVLKIGLPERPGAHD